MFDHLGFGEVAVLLVLSLMVFGPDRLPGVAADLGRGVRRGRTALRRLTADVRSELGPELDDLRQLQPRGLRDRLWAEDETVSGR